MWNSLSKYKDCDAFQNANTSPKGVRIVHTNNSTARGKKRTRYPKANRVIVCSVEWLSVGLMLLARYYSIHANSICIERGQVVPSCKLSRQRGTSLNSWRTSPGQRTDKESSSNIVSVLKAVRDIKLLEI